LFDFGFQVIDERQDRMTKRLKEWQRKFIQTLMEWVFLLEFS